MNKPARASFHVLSAIGRSRLAVIGVGVFSGHLHGGQWRLPGLGLGVCGPSAGGPPTAERLVFPRHAGGAYALKDNSTLVVSRGLARESTPIPRFFNHPELVAVTLRPGL